MEWEAEGRAAFAGSVRQESLDEILLQDLSFDVEARPWSNRKFAAFRGPICPTRNPRFLEDWVRHRYAAAGRNSSKIAHPRIRFF